MENEYELSFTAKEIDERLTKAGSAVLYTQQTLTEEQKAQARKNIGADGGSGGTGADGYSPSAKVEQTSDGAKITITDKSGTTTATATNGKDGKDGADGKTPVRGTDYWTPDDQNAIIQQVIDTLGGVPVFGTVDNNNTIVLSGNLAEGVYTLKYEDAYGNVTEIGTLNHSNAPTTVSILDTYELQLNKRWSASSKKWSDCNGMLGVAVPFEAIKDKVVRITGFVKNQKTSDDNAARWYGINASNATQYGTFNTTSGGTTDDLWSSKIVDEGNGTYSIAITAENIGIYTNANVTQVMMHMPINNTGTAITDADLANLSMIIADE